MSVWTLEYLVTQSMFEEFINEYCNKIIIQTDEEKTATLKTIHDIISNCEICPEGTWFKSISLEYYRNFCNVAKDTIMNKPHFKYRVINTTTDENGNEKSVVNNKVLKYLMATLDEREVSYT